MKAEKPFHVGAVLKFKGHDKEFTQLVSSMQVDHKAVERAEVGVEVGIKVDQPVKEKDEVFIEG